jgi:hypothetical protein
VNPKKENVLNFWEKTYGILHPHQREAFLKRHELHSLCKFPKTTVFYSVKRHQHLAEALKGARKIALRDQGGRALPSHGSEHCQKIRDATDFTRDDPGDIQGWFSSDDDPFEY